MPSSLSLSFLNMPSKFALLPLPSFKRFKPLRLARWSFPANIYLKLVPLVALQLLNALTSLKLLDVSLISKPSGSVILYL